MKKLTGYLIAALSVALFICVSALVENASRARRHLVTCNTVTVTLRDTLNLLSEDDVRSYLDRACPALIGQRIDSIRLYQVERALQTRSAIRTAEAWTTPDGTLHIGITQRDPVAKFVYSGYACYIDASGFIFPLQGNCKKSIPVFECEALPDEGSKDAVLALIAYMDRHQLSAKFPVIKVEKGNELVLLPAEGKERFIFGKPERIAEKFGSIADYYKKISASGDDVHYRSVNVKYRGQIICRQ